jgi:hypothetical protein
VSKELKRLKTQKIDFIATGLPIVPSLSQQKGMPPVKSGAQGIKLSNSSADLKEPLEKSTCELYVLAQIRTLDLRNTRQTA